MDIKKIIKIFDDELIDNNKAYLTLGQANKLLVDNEIITVSEKSKNVLKKLLEKNEIPHAIQTNKKPKQWRIPLSNEGNKRQEAIEKEPKITNCPNCNINLTIPSDIIRESYIQCLNCYENFKNPFANKKPVKSKSNNNQNEISITKNQRNWIVVIVIVGFLWLIGAFSDNDSSTITLYKVNTTTYVGTSKANYDEMFDYLSTSDMQALSSLMLNGKVELLTSGTEVYLLEAHFGYAVVRLNGSTQKLWIVSDHITKE